jgi:Flp pilus assembly pilin Flp
VIADLEGDVDLSSNGSRMRRSAIGFMMRLNGGEFLPLFRLLGDTRGATAIEYTLIIALIAVAFIVLITQIGDFVSVPFETVASHL